MMEDGHLESSEGYFFMRQTPSKRQDFGTSLCKDLNEAWLPLTAYQHIYKLRAKQETLSDSCRQTADMTATWIWFILR